MNVNMEQSMEQTMEQTILEAAERLFLEKGFAGTSTTQIARVAGCNQALVHYYFRTKENLFNTIFEQKFKMFFEHVFEPGDLQHMSFEEKLRRIVESHFDLLRTNPKIPMLVLNELVRLPGHIQILKEKLHVFPETLYGFLNEELLAEIAAGRVRNDITLFDIVATMITQNVALFLMLPVVREILGFTEEQVSALIVRRREENVQVVLRYVRA